MQRRPRRTGITASYSGLWNFLKYHRVYNLSAMRLWIAPRTDGSQTRGSFPVRLREVAERIHSVVYVCVDRRDPKRSQSMACARRLIKIHYVFEYWISEISFPCYRNRPTARPCAAPVRNRTGLADRVAHRRPPAYTASRARTFDPSGSLAR